LLRNWQRRLQSLIREEMDSASETRSSAPFDSNGTPLDRSAVRLGDPMLSGSHAMLADSLTFHGS
jgi:hypothetical protein